MVLVNYVYSATCTIIQINAVPSTLFQIKVICNALGLITSVLYAVYKSLLSFKKNSQLNTTFTKLKEL